MYNDDRIHVGMSQNAGRGACGTQEETGTGDRRGGMRA